MIVLPLMAVWLIVPPVLGYLIGRWWSLAFALLFFPAFALWDQLRTKGYGAGDGPVFEMWFVYLLVFLFLSLPPLALSALAIAWRRYS